MKTKPLHATSKNKVAVIHPGSPILPTRKAAFSNETKL